MNGRARPILAAVLEYGEFPEILRVADIVRQKCGRDVVIFFAKNSYRRLVEDTTVAVAAGHTWMDAKGVRHDTPASAMHGCERSGTPMASKSTSRAGGYLRALAVDIVIFLSDLRRFRARAREIKSVLKAVRPQLIILGQGTLGSELSFLLIAARQMGLPSLLVPFAMFNLEEFTEYAAGCPSYHVCTRTRPLNRVLARLFPKWAKSVRDADVIRLPGARALALTAAGLAPEDPWPPCAGPATAIAVDSNASRQSLIDIGVPAEPIKVVGSTVQDLLARHRAAGKAEMFARFSLDFDRPLLVCGWPANMFAWLGERRALYQDYASLARAWASMLAAIRDEHGIQVLITVHPKTLDQELIEPISRGLTVVRGNTDQLIAHCDFFTTLNGSSITAWAIACAKPIVLFDCFQTGYREFLHLAGCAMTFDESSFVFELRRLCDPRVRAAKAHEMACIAADWGLLDGRAADRLVALIEKLLVHGESSRQTQMETIAGLASR